MLNKIPSLANLGRANRNVHDTQMENIIGHLSKLALKHEKDADGSTRWALMTKAADDEDED